MLWIVRWVVCAWIAVGAASQAHGETIGRSEGAAHSPRTSPASVGKAALASEVRAATLELPQGGSFAFVQPGVSAVLPRALANRLGLLTGAPDLASARRVGLTLTEAPDDDETGVHYALSKRVTLGLSYERVTEETMAFEAAETGSLHGDYSSHHVVFQARWEF